MIRFYQTNNLLFFCLYERVIYGKVIMDQHFQKCVKLCVIPHI